MIKIMLDPGHGGSDPGAASNGLLEKDLNLALSNRLTRLLKASGFEVSTTRTSDTRVELAERVSVEHVTQPDFFISLHGNAAAETGDAALSDATVSGIKTFIFASGGKVEQLALAIQAALIIETGEKDRGVKTRSLYVLRNTQAPAVLVEMGFITNMQMAEKLKTDAYRDRIAAAIAKGICKHIGVDFSFPERRVTIDALKALGYTGIKFT